MAKLDKQGLNTFIRELDKHINTKINRLDISPKADKVLMSDGTSVEETVSANKTSILEHTELINENNENITDLSNNVYTKTQINDMRMHQKTLTRKYIGVLPDGIIYTIPENKGVGITNIYVSAHRTNRHEICHFQVYKNYNKSVVVKNFNAGGDPNSLLTIEGDSGDLIIKSNITGEKCQYYIAYETYLSNANVSSGKTLENKDDFEVEIIDIQSIQRNYKENENKISILESENKELREELTQIQTSIASLTSLITATLEEK